jgi:heat shock protein HslJ
MPNSNPSQGLARLVAVCLILALIGACRSGGTRAEVRPSPFGAWEVTWLEGIDLAALSAQGLPLPTLHLGADGTLTAHGGVNRISARYGALELTGGRFQTTPLVSTRMAGPPEAMELERRFQSALEAVDEAVVDGDELLLLHEGELYLRFERAPPGVPPLARSGAPL